MKYLVNNTTFNTKLKMPNTIDIFNNPLVWVTSIFNLKIFFFYISFLNPFNQQFRHIATWKNYNSCPFDWYNFYNLKTFFQTFTLFMFVIVRRTHTSWKKYSLILFLLSIDPTVPQLLLFNFEELLEILDIEQKFKRR